jgi:hypothetical protein
MKYKMMSQQEVDHKMALYHENACFREVAALLGKVAERMDDIKDQFSPDDAEDLASAIIKVDKAIAEAEALALEYGNAYL